MAFCDTLRVHDPSGAHNSVHISVHLQVDRIKDRVYFLAGFFFLEGYFPAGLFFPVFFFFRKSEAIVLVVCFAQNSEEYNI